MTLQLFASHADIHGQYSPRTPAGGVPTFYEPQVAPMYVPYSGTYSFYGGGLTVGHTAPQTGIGAVDPQALSAGPHMVGYYLPVRPLGGGMMSLGQFGYPHYGAGASYVPASWQQHQPYQLYQHHTGGPSDVYYSPLDASESRHSVGLLSSLSDREEKDASIDYSSLVRYTISPSLKRRKRSRTQMLPGNQKELYPCPHCNKTFLKPYNLKSHMKTHSDDKPFKCSLCGKRFARSHDRKRHESLHAGEKNFKCEGFLKDGVTSWGCGKKFARADALARHFRTETGWLCIKPLMDEAKESEKKEALGPLAMHPPLVTSQLRPPYPKSGLDEKHLPDPFLSRKMINPS